MVKLLNVDERSEILEKRLNAQRDLFPDKKAFIKHCLECAWGMSGFIIFQCSDEDNFCQFLLVQGLYSMDISSTPDNNHFPHLKQARKLLEKMDLTFTDTSLLKYMDYNYDSYEDRYSINANFGTNAELAAEFVKRTFEEIYKEDLGLLKVTLGQASPVKEQS